MPAGRPDYIQQLVTIREDAKVRQLARTRAGDAELAEDALQETFEVLARIRHPEQIADLRAYFCRVLIRVIGRLRGQLGAILPDDFASLADTCQGQARNGARPRPVDEAVAANLLAGGWLERFAANRASLTAEVPGRSRDFARYREVIARVAGQVLHSIVTGDVCDADSSAALRAAYPEWFAEDGLTAGNAFQRSSRARADVRDLLRKIITRDDLYS
jgi:hypothetical protein